MFKDIVTNKESKFKDLEEEFFKLACFFSGIFYNFFAYSCPCLHNLQMYLATKNLTYILKKILEQTIGFTMIHSRNIFILLYISIIYVLLLIYQ